VGNTLPSLLLRAAPVATDRWESEVLFYQGQFIQLDFKRNLAPAPLGLEVRNFETRTLIASQPYDGMFGCAVVVGDTIHVFGRVVLFDGRVAIRHSTISSADGWVLHDLGIVWTFARAEKVFNLGVSSYPSGYWLTSACEGNDDGVIILTSPDLTNFSFSCHLRSGLFTGTPQPYWLENRPYMTFLNRIPGGSYGSLYATVGLRGGVGGAFSTLTEPSTRVLLFPDHFDQDSVSLADFSAAEGDGKTAFSFAASDQGGGAPFYCALRQGYYLRGGLSSLMAELFS
jgi:hypothetical protein